MMSRSWSLTLVLLLGQTPLWPQSPDPANSGAETTKSSSLPAKSEASQDSTVQAATTPKANPGDSTTLKAIYAPNAVYPRKAADENIQGQVWVKLSISETGDVEKVEVVSGNPILTEAAVEAYKKWKFRPYIKGGKAVKVSVKLPMDFAARDQIKDIIPPMNERTATQDKAVKVPAAITKGMLVHKVTPIYPDGAILQRIQGTVLLRAIIGKDGRVRSLEPVSGPDVLIPAAMGAVQQWRYTPYLINHEPVEVDTQVTVNFTLGR